MLSEKELEKKYGKKIENWTQKEWYDVLSEKEISDDFLIKYAEKIPFLFRRKKFDINFLEKFIFYYKNKKKKDKNFVLFKELFLFQDIDDNFLIKHIDIVDLKYVKLKKIENLLKIFKDLFNQYSEKEIFNEILIQYKIPEKLIVEYQDKINFKALNQYLSESFLLKFLESKDFDWERVFKKNQKISLGFFEKVLNSNNIPLEKKEEIINEAIKTGYEFDESFLEKVLKKNIKLKKLPENISFSFVKKNFNNIEEEYILNKYAHELSEKKIKEILEKVKNEENRLNYYLFLILESYEKSENKFNSYILDFYIKNIKKLKYPYFNKFTKKFLFEKIINEIDSLEHLFILLETNNRTIIALLKKSKDAKSIIKNMNCWKNCLLKNIKNLSKKGYSKDIALKISLNKIIDKMNLIKNKLKIDVSQEFFKNKNLIIEK